MTKQDEQDPPDFQVVDQKIASLLKRLQAKNICPHCASWALATNAADLAEAVMGSTEAIEMFEDIIAQLREDAIPSLDDPGPSAAVH